MATATSADGALETYREAVHAHDERRILEAYADDAVVIAYSERNRPGSARAIEGRSQIEAWLHDVMERNLKHTLSNEVVGDDRFSFIETCVYPSGEHVVGAYACEVRDGKIVRQVGSEAWDE
jgi:hypothetical protein